MKKLLLLAVLLACGGSGTEPKKEVSPVGAYVLQTIDEAPLPWFYDGDSVAVRAGRLELYDESNYRDILTYDYVWSGIKVATTDTVEGQYRIQESAIQFASPYGYSSAGYDGQAITMAGAQVWVYKR